VKEIETGNLLGINTDVKDVPINPNYDDYDGVSSVDSNYKRKMIQDAVTFV
jgi:hypothetical protein